MGLLDAYEEGTCVAHQQNADSLFVEYSPWTVNRVTPTMRRMDEFDAISARLAGRVKTRRKAIGLSQEALAFEADIDRTYVSQIERSVGNPSLMVLCRLAKVLQISVAELLVDESATR